MAKKVYIIEDEQVIMAKMYNQLVKDLQEQISQQERLYVAAIKTSKKKKKTDGLFKLIVNG